jgi:hypothetical protein
MGIKGLIFNPVSVIMWGIVALKETGIVSFDLFLPSIIMIIIYIILFISDIIS